MTDEPARPARAQPAAGSSFYLGMRILPRPQREAMYAIYAFCRAVDDIADEEGSRPARHAALEGWRADIEALYRGDVHPAVGTLAPYVERFRLPRESFLDVVDGMEMDVRADIVAPDWAVLDLYCDRVASAVGRLSARVFGLGERDADDLAHHLGRALQLTNILRDLDEDAAIGRLYLPRESLERAGIRDVAPAAILAHPGLAQTCREVIDRARLHFDEADAIMGRQRKRHVRAPRLMEIAYRSILERVAARGFEPPRRRIGTNKLGLAFAALRLAIA